MANYPNPPHLRPTIKPIDKGVSANPEPRRFSITFQDSPMDEEVVGQIQVTDSGALIITHPDGIVLAYADGVWRSVCEI